MNINARLAAIERKLGSKERPIMLLFGDDPTPDTPDGAPAPIILHFSEDLRGL
jgi:hypothetical protein